jgi:hypothetical protein
LRPHVRNDAICYSPFEIQDFFDVRRLCRILFTRNAFGYIGPYRAWTSYASNQAYMSFQFAKKLTEIIECGGAPPGEVLDRGPSHPWRLKRRTGLRIMARRANGYFPLHGHFGIRFAAECRRSASQLVTPRRAVACALQSRLRAGPRSQQCRAESADQTRTVYDFQNNGRVARRYQR